MKFDFLNYNPENKEYQCLACLKRHRSQRKHCKSVDLNNSQSISHRKYILCSL